MSVLEFNSYLRRLQTTLVASYDSPLMPPSYKVEGRQKNGKSLSVNFILNKYLRLQVLKNPAHKSSIPKLDQTMMYIYTNELYNLSF